MRKFVATLGFACALAASLPARAVDFTYEWVGTSTTAGTVGTGSMSFSAASVSDPANFSGLNFLSSLTSLTYTWTNAGNSRTVNYTGPVTSGLFANNTLAAVNGVLSNVVISNFPTNSFALSIAPSTPSAVGISQNSSTGSFIDADNGAWRLAVAVPEPGTWVLMAAGLSGMLLLARRRPRG